MTDEMQGFVADPGSIDFYVADQVGTASSVSENGQDRGTVLYVHAANKEGVGVHVALFPDDFANILGAAARAEWIDKLRTQDGDPAWRFRKHD